MHSSETKLVAGGGRRRRHPRRLVALFHDMPHDHENGHDDVSLALVEHVHIVYIVQAHHVAMGRRDRALLIVVYVEVEFDDAVAAQLPTDRFDIDDVFDMVELLMQLERLTACRLNVIHMVDRHGFRVDIGHFGFPTHPRCRSCRGC